MQTFKFLSKSILVFAEAIASLIITFSVTQLFTQSVMVFAKLDSNLDSESKLSSYESQSRI